MELLKAIMEGDNEIVPLRDRIMVDIQVMMSMIPRTPVKSF